MDRMGTATESDCYFSFLFFPFLFDISDSIRLYAVRFECVFRQVSSVGSVCSVDRHYQ